MATAGQFVWCELMTRDIEKAKAFYGPVVHWRFSNWDGDTGGTPYIMMSRSDDPKESLGGFMEMREPEFPNELPSHFMGYISVDDADATTAKAVELGATVIHGPADIPNVGRFSIIADPQGAAFSILQSLNSEWEKQPPRVGDVCWMELSTTDLEAGFAFYRDLFGWEIKQDMDMGDAGLYRLVTCPASPAEGDYGFGGMMTKAPDAPGPSAWTHIFWVPDLDASLATATELGGTVLSGPMDVPGGSRVAYLLDPEGTPFALLT